MPTQNPKISAYVPQVVYDSFKEYEKKHGGSMSQAVTQLLADHLGVDLSTFTIKSTGGLQSEIESLRNEANSLKNEVVELKEKIANLSEKVDYILSTSSSHKNNKSPVGKVEVSSEQESKPFSVEDKSLDISVTQVLGQQDTASISVNDFIVQETKEQEISINQDVLETHPDVAEDTTNKNALIEELNVKDLSTIQDDINSKLKGEPLIENNDLYEQSEILHLDPIAIEVLDINQENPTKVEDNELEQQGNPLHSSASKPLLQLEVEQIDGELPSDIPHENIDLSTAPLKISELAKQFGLSDSMLGKASKFEITKQIEYTASKNPDQIPWVYSQLKKRFYALRKPE